MMRKISAIFIISLILFSISSCRDGIEDGFSYPKHKVWAHRVNSPEQANLKMKSFDGVEIDLAYDKVSGELYVSHDVEKGKMNLTFRQFLQQLENPAKTHYWLDLKNLWDNTEGICDTISNLARLYGFENKFFVESWSAKSLKIAKEKGLTTSLWVGNVCDGRAIDTLAWKEKLSKDIEKCNPDALSAEFRMWRLLVEHFPDKNIHLWHTPAKYNEENVKLTRDMCRDKHVKVVLVDYDEPISY